MIITLTYFQAALSSRKGRLLHPLAGSHAVPIIHITAAHGTPLLPPIAATQPPTADSSSPRATAATAEYTLSRIEAKRLHIDLC